MKGSKEMTIVEGFFKGLPNQWFWNVCNTCNFEVMITVLFLFQSWARVMVKIRIQGVQGISDLRIDICIVTSEYFRKPDLLGH